MNINALPYIALIATSCALLWYLYFWLYKDYVTDVFRQRIFVLRDELFDEVANGMIAFDHPAYTVLRRAMNGYIRFSHQMSLLHVMIHSLMIDKKTIQEDPFSFEKQFSMSIQDLNCEEKIRLKKIKRKLRLLLTSYLLSESPVFIALIVLFFIIPVIISLLFYNRVKDFVRSVLLIKIKNIEAEAFALGKL